jgi:hypothetical protein
MLVSYSDICCCSRGGDSISQGFGLFWYVNNFAFCDDYLECMVVWFNSPPTTGVLFATITLHNPPAIIIDKREKTPAELQANTSEALIARARERLLDYRNDVRNYEYRVHRLDLPQPDEWCEYEEVSRYSAFQQFVTRNALTNYHAPLDCKKCTQDTLSWDVVPDTDYMELMLNISKMHSLEQQQKQLQLQLQQLQHSSAASAVVTAVTVVPEAAASSIAVPGQQHQQEQHHERFGSPNHKLLKEDRKRTFKEKYDHHRDSEAAPTCIVERYKEKAGSFDIIRYKGKVEEALKGPKKRYEFCCNFCETFYPCFAFTDIVYKHESSSHPQGTLTFTGLQKGHPYTTYDKKEKVWILFHHTKPPLDPLNVTGINIIFTISKSRECTIHTCFGEPFYF